MQLIRELQDLLERQPDPDKRRKQEMKAINAYNKHLDEMVRDFKTAERR